MNNVTTRMIRRSRSLTAVLSTLVLASACWSGGELETRTFELGSLHPADAVGLIDPYVYGDREGAPGAISPSEGAITVRELPENLDRIATVLAEYDRPAPSVRLDFMLIEANGYTGSDAAIADIESELRSLFNFDGYRLAARTSMQAVERGDIRTSLGERGYRLEAKVWDIDETEDGGSLTMDVAINDLFSSSVSIPIGETVILGSGDIPSYLSEDFGDVRAAILVVTPRRVEGSPR